MSGPLRIVFDHRIFASQVHGGISRYFAGMVACLPDHGCDPRVIAPLYKNRHLGELDRHTVWGRHIPDMAGSTTVSMAAGRVLARPLAALAGAQIVHETYYGTARGAPRRCPIVLTVYDMIHEIHPELFAGDDTQARKRAALMRADRIVCISESTRRDMLHFYPQLESKASVTLLGHDQRFHAPASADGSDGTRRPYLLHVGPRQSYKNFDSLLQAYARSPRLRAEFDLVCAGSAGFGTAEREAIAALGVTGAVHHHPADDAQLQQWYRGAAAFVYPSRYEGFGIPPLEAMSAGCPVVVVRTSSLPEACGEAAQYAEHASPEALGTAIEAVVFSPDRSAELRALGLQWAAGFTWDRTAQATAAIYRELV